MNEEREEIKRKKLHKERIKPPKKQVEWNEEPEKQIKQQYEIKKDGKKRLNKTVKINILRKNTRVATNVNVYTKT